jgi:hypothetical protein
MTKLDFEYLRALAYSLVTGKALNVSTFVQPVSVPMTVRFSEDSRPSRLGRRVGTIENILRNSGREAAEKARSGRELSKINYRGTVHFTF